MDRNIRAITPEFFEESAAVIRRAFGTVAEEFGFTPENNPTNGAFIQGAKLAEEQARGVKQYGLFQGQTLAGFVALEQAAEPGLFYLEKLAVLPELRHLGYGTLLLDFARDTVRQLGGTAISIAIVNENTRLKQWYQAYGFRETGCREFPHLTFTVCFLQIPV